MTGLGFLDPTYAHRSSIAQAVSANGLTVVGSAVRTDSLNDHISEAFRWNAGIMTGLGFLDPTNANYYSAAYDISADGLTVVGDSMNADTYREAFRWNAGVMTGLGFLDPTNANRDSMAIAISADGSSIVGRSRNADNAYEAYRWNAGVITGLGFLDPLRANRESYASDVSADGSTIVGQSLNTDGVYEAFRWNAGVITGLGFLDPSDPFRSSFAYSVSADGSTVVGNSLNDGNVLEAFRWTDSGGMESVASWLGPTVDVTGIQIDYASGISADGAVVVGQMLLDKGLPTERTEAYLARVGGLISPNDAVASLAEVAAPSTFAGSAIGQTSESGLDCVDHGPTGLCVFADLRYDFDPAFTGSAGVSTRIGDHGRVGGSASRVHQSVTLAFDGSAASRGSVGSLFGAWEAAESEGLQFFASLAYGYFDTSVGRGYVNGAGTSISHGETTVHGFGSYTRVAWRTPFEQAIVTPFADLVGLWIHQRGYTETTGPFAATIDARDAKSLVAQVGLGADISLTTNLHFRVSAAWGHQMVNDVDPVSGNLIGLIDINAASPRGATDWIEWSIGPSVTFGKNATAHLTLFGICCAAGAFDYSSVAGVRQAF